MHLRIGSLCRPSYETVVHRKPKNGLVEEGHLIMHQKGFFSPGKLEEDSSGSKPWWKGWL